MKNFDAKTLPALERRIRSMTKWDIYHRVAAVLWDLGVRDDTLCQGKTFSKAASEAGIPEPYVCNAWGIIRGWQREGGPPDGIPRV
jgi:hypothetical protein